MSTDDSVQIRCPKCKSKFRDRARKIQSGYSRECPRCERVIFFERGSPNDDIRDALQEAERVRRAIRQEETEAPRPTHGQWYRSRRC